MTVDVAEQFAAWVSASQAAEQERLEKIKFEELSQRYRDVSRDLDRERRVARISQEDTEGLKQRFEELQECVERSSFVLVLIDADADGYIFKDEYYSDVDGGRRAALDLRASVQAYLKRAHSELSNLPIVIKAFAKQFSQAFDTCDFVLVGSGKDRADEKIKGVFKQFIANPTCRHVVFGACHDNGYARTLENHQQGDVAKKISLLYPFEIGGEFASLKFQSTKLEDVFRTEPVNQRQSPTPIQPALHISTPDTQATASLGWEARLGGTGFTAPGVTSRKIEDLPPGLVYVNEREQRLDAVYPRPSPEALVTWSHKVKNAKMRYCRKYYLQGGCGGGCGYSHGPLTEGEILAFRHDLQLEKCHAGVKCRDPRCFYGHHCSCDRKSLLSLW
ncbi:hypothetical protein BDW62DRAFT_213286 [Aspergillus aurantiobrunneus]